MEVRWYGHGMAAVAMHGRVRHHSYSEAFPLRYVGVSQQLQLRA